MSGFIGHRTAHDVRRFSSFLVAGLEAGALAALVRAAVATASAIVTIGGLSGIARGRLVAIGGLGFQLGVFCQG